MQKIIIGTDSIRLDQFLKWVNLASSGGEAKFLIQSGNVKVNGEQVFSRGKKLEPGDQVEFMDEETFLIINESEED